MTSATQPLFAPHASTHVAVGGARTCSCSAMRSRSICTLPPRLSRAGRSGAANRLPKRRSPWASKQPCKGAAALLQRALIALLQRALHLFRHERPASAAAKRKVSIVNGDRVENGTQASAAHVPQPRGTAPWPPSTGDGDGARLLWCKVGLPGGGPGVKYGRLYTSCGWFSPKRRRRECVLLLWVHSVSVSRRPI